MGCSIFLNGEPVTEIPQDALDIMSERLSRVVSSYFARHPEEYEAYLAGKEQMKKDPQVPA